ncbi:MAG: hypothetical protein DRP78_04985, partial [Candidatus Omnitrophota bacterium]
MLKLIRFFLVLQILILLAAALRLQYAACKIDETVFSALAPNVCLCKENFKRSFECMEQKIEKIISVYSKICAQDAWPAFTHTLDFNGKEIGIFLVTDTEAANQIAMVLPVNSNTKFCDLGSGIGNVCCVFAAYGAESVGYEIDQKLVDLSKSIIEHEVSDVINPEKVEFERRNFLNKDLSNFDIIFYYRSGLMYDYRHQLMDKLQNELKPGAFLVIYGYGKINDHIPGLTEAAYLKGYAKIRTFARIYTKLDTQIDVNTVIPQNIYWQNLFSQDPAARLKAAIVLKKAGINRDEVNKILSDSVFDESLTVYERVTAGDSLDMAEQTKKVEEAYTLQKLRINVLLKQERIEQSNVYLGKDDLLLIDGLKNLFKQIPGMESDIVQFFIDKVEKINWDNEELSRMFNGVSYFNGSWKQELSDKLQSSHNFSFEMASDAVSNVPDYMICSADDYACASI